jgi:anti-sigma factor RsiW
MITCRDLEIALYAFVEGEAAPDQCRNLEQHLCGCPHCAALVETYRITIRVCRKLPPTPMPPGVLERLTRALQDLSEPEA